MRLDTSRFASDFLELTVKGVSAAAVAVYVALNIAYQRFYGPLGLSPEDLGVDQSFILSRAVAVLPMALFPVVIVSLTSFIFAKIVNVEHRRVLVSLFLIVPCVLVMIYFAIGYVIRQDPLIIAILNEVWVALFLLGALNLRTKRAQLIRVLSVVIATVAIGAVFASVAASIYASEARQGMTVQPVSVWPYLVPLVDVQASVASIEWTGPDGSAPHSLFPNASSKSASVIYLGQSDALVFLIVNGKTIRLPPANIVVSTTDTP